VAVNLWDQADDAEQVWTNGLQLARRLAGSTFDRALEEQRAGWSVFGTAWILKSLGTPNCSKACAIRCLRCTQLPRREPTGGNVLCKLGGEVYSGVNFWDTEIYCHRDVHVPGPPGCAPNSSCTATHYLPGQSRMPQRVDLEGARYPFSTITGYEDSGTWQHVDLEIHQNEAIFYAILALRAGVQGQGVPVPRGR